MESVKKLHARIIVSGQLSCHLLMFKVLRSYALSSSNLGDACSAFKQIEAPTTMLQNIMIRGFAQSDAPKEAFALYNSARRSGMIPDNRTFPFLLKACSKLCAVAGGKMVHTQAVKLGFYSDIFVSNALIHFYATCGDLGHAKYIFDNMQIKDIVSWNSLICGYSQNNHLTEALKIFQLMQQEGVKADSVTLSKVIAACTTLGEWELADSALLYMRDYCINVDLHLGNALIDHFGRRGLVQSAEEIFHAMKEHNVVTGNSMITTYAKGGYLLLAKKVFDEMPEKDLITWSAMICGYSQANMFSDALALFHKMHDMAIIADEILVVSVLSACSNLGALELGRWIHDYIKRNGVKEDLHVGNSLVDMYGKCGYINEAFRVFREMHHRDTLSYNSIILGLANNGLSETALQIFNDMLSKGIPPNDVTFIGVLTACANNLLVADGLQYFRSMRSYNVEPHMKHYGCMVDLFCRVGQLDDALTFILKMPMQADSIVWRILLVGCNIHGNTALAELVTKKLNELDPSNSSNYVLMHNAYASVQRWNDAKKTREMMSVSFARKSPGCSVVGVVNS